MIEETEEKCKCMAIGEKRGEKEVNTKIVLNMNKKQMKMEDMCEILNITRHEIELLIKPNKEFDEYDLLINQNKEKIKKINKNQELKNMYEKEIYNLQTDIELANLTRNEAIKEKQKEITYNMYKKSININDICEITEMERGLVEGIIEIENSKLSA